MKKMIMIAGGALLLVGASVGGTLFLTGGNKPAPGVEGGGAAAAPPTPPQLETFYHTFDPEFIVNFTGNTRERFFMADVTVSTTDEAVIEVLEKHNPELRNDLLMLFGNQDGAYISTADGKTELRKQALTVVQNVVEKHYGAPYVEEVFFTRFVVQ